jgi:hypothetical protein
LGLSLDLSPSLIGSAIDSLNQDEKDKFQLAVKRVGEYRFLRNKLQSLEESTLTYAKIKRLFLAWKINGFTSSQHMLKAFANNMYLSGCDYAYLVDDSSLQGFIKSF